MCNKILATGIFLTSKIFMVNVKYAVDTIQYKYKRFICFAKRGNHSENLYRLNQC